LSHPKLPERTDCRSCRWSALICTSVRWGVAAGLRCCITPAFLSINTIMI